MRCPKCHYLSFEPEPRCRNCGYDLTLEPADLAVRPDPSEPPAPDLDLVLRPADSPSAPESPASSGAASPAAPNTTELPLFVKGLSDRTLQTPAPDAFRESPTVEPRVAAPTQPLEDPPVTTRAVHPPASSPGVPRTRAPQIPPRSPAIEDDFALPRAPRPLSVRRPTPAPGRVREKYQPSTAAPRRDIGLLERDLLEGLDTASKPAPAPPPIAAAAALAGPVEEPIAGAGARLVAALVDLLFLGGINAAIVWLTLARLDLTVGQIGTLPILPIATLLFLLDGLYLLMFTATNGQTIGKMAAGIRVVGEDDDAESFSGDRVTLKQATLRALFTFPAVLALGAGFLPLFTGGLPLHDRFAHTRVVRA